MTPEEKLEAIQDLVNDVHQLNDDYDDPEAIIRDKVLDEIYKIINP